MWKKNVVCLALLATVQGAMPAFGEVRPIDVMEYLPDPAELRPWMPEDEPRTAEGETLFMLINGAAEMYFEYGFERAIFQSYVDDNGQWIDVEIYEMKDAAAAYGLQSIKQGNSGKPLDIGQEAYVEEYYLNFRKGNVQVSVVGQDSSEATLNAIVSIAKAVEAGIPGHGEAPELIGLFQEPDISPRSSIYIKGQIGLSNSLPIVPDTIAGFDEGVVARYNDFTLALLKYPSTGEAASSFGQTAEALRQDLEKGTAGEQEFSTVLDAGTLLVLRVFQPYIIVVSGENVQQAKDVQRKLEGLLK